MDKDEYPSDSDQSDEDFCPTKGQDSDVPSEEESDYDGDDVEDVTEKKLKSKTSNKPKTKEETTTTRVSRHTAAAATSSTSKCADKDELESDDEDKKRSDALWADFLGDSEPSSSSATTVSVSTSTKVHSKSKSETPKPSTRRTSPTPAEPQTSTEAEVSSTKTIEEILDFAGEEIKVVKNVESPSPSQPQVGADKKFGIGNRAIPTKRAGGGLGNILGQIGKKSKISVLEKSKLDWNSFKHNEGINEELQTFNKGRNGYLERQDFLQRTDVRQFEIEKSLRQTKRSNR